LFERVSNANIMAVMDGDKIDFTISNKKTARVGEDGIIEVESEPGRP
jgi:hypothetical protein